METQWSQGHTGLGVNHLLRVSPGPIGCLGTRPSGLKPKGGGSSSPASVCPTSPGEMTLMLLATEMVVPQEGTSLRRKTPALPLGSPSPKGEAILALTEAPS